MLRNVAVFTSATTGRLTSWRVFRPASKKPSKMSNSGYTGTQLVWHRSANSIAGATNIDRCLAPGRRAIVGGNITLELLNLMLLNQTDGAAAKPGASQS